MKQTLENIKHLSGLTDEKIQAILTAPTLFSDAKANCPPANILIIEDPLGVVTDSQFSQWLQGTLAVGSGLSIMVCGGEAFSAVLQRAKDRRGWNLLETSPNWSVILTPWGKVTITNGLPDATNIALVDIVAGTKDTMKGSCGGTVEHLRAFEEPKPAQP